MKFISLLIFFPIFSCLAFSYENKNSASLNFSPSISTISGSRSLIGLRDGFTALEDLAVNENPWQISSAWQIFLRTISLVTIELPVDYMLMLLQHEFFGHGARYRELLGADPHFVYADPPIPFGKGLAISTYTSPKKENTLMNAHIANVGGVTAVDVMREDLAFKWLQNQEIQGRSSFLYLLNALQTSGYLWFGDLILKDGSRGDMRNYIDVVNIFYQNDKLLTLGKLKKLAAINLIDPFIFYSFYSLYHYARYGTDSKTWMIPFGSNVKYLPAIKMVLAPFGPEYYLHNYMLIFNRALDLVFHGGSVKEKFYWGIGVNSQIYQYKFLMLGIHVELWQQPYIDFNAEAAFKDFSFGGMGTIYGSFKVFDHLSLDLELGGKSKGFVLGEVIGAAFLARGGLTLHF